MSRSDSGRPASRRYSPLVPFSTALTSSYEPSTSIWREKEVDVDDAADVVVVAGTGLAMAKVTRAVRAAIGRNMLANGAIGMLQKKSVRVSLPVDEVRML